MGAFLAALKALAALFGIISKGQDAAKAADDRQAGRDAQKVDTQDATIASLERQKDAAGKAATSEAEVSDLARKGKF